MSPFYAGVAVGVVLGMALLPCVIFVAVCLVEAVALRRR